MRHWGVFFLGCIISFMTSAGAADVVRKTHVIRGQDYSVDIFYQDDQQIASQRQGTQGSSDLEGQIPDGRVRFYNEHDKTYGEEYFKRGQRHGLSKTYYPDGRLMKESHYLLGELVAEKEYYKDGRLRAEMDLSRACRDCGTGHEKGEGKLYYSNGRLKYEWNFNNGTLGYQKAYTKNGELRFEAHYDQQGNRREDIL